MGLGWELGWDHGAEMEPWGPGWDQDHKAQCPHHCSGVTWGWDGTWDQDKGWDGKMAPKGLGWDQDPRPSVPITAVG